MKHFKTSLKQVKQSFWSSFTIILTTLTDSRYFGDLFFNPHEVKVSESGKKKKPPPKKTPKNPGIRARSLPPGLAENKKHITLTHSTSLTKPRGSFSGVKFSRNPVIMMAFWRQNSLPAETGAESGPTGRGKMGVVCHNDVVSLKREAARDV